MNGGVIKRNKDDILTKGLESLKYEDVNGYEMSKTVDNSSGERTIVYISFRGTYTLRDAKEDLQSVMVPFACTKCDHCKKEY